MLIVDGSATLKNSPAENTAMFRSGDIFGESDLLNIIGVDFLGDIYAGNTGLTCLCIEKPDKIFQLFEVELLREILKN